MSVGGMIVDLVKVNDAKVWVNTIEPDKFGHPISLDVLARYACAIYCNPLGEPLEVGDALWWQGGTCYWTPRVHPDGRSDVKLPKIGYSGVNHPDARP